MNKWVHEDLVTDKKAEGLRVDRYISDVLRLFSRSQIRQRDVEVSVNGKPVKLSKVISLNDRVTVRYAEPREPDIAAEDIPLDIIFENSRALVINKPQGMVVHPAAGNYSGTLVQALLYHVKQLRESFTDEPVRPGIVHRLDKETSGIIVAAKDPEALNKLAAQFARKKVHKIYLAVVKGHVQKLRGEVDYPIARDPHHRKRFTWKRQDGKSSLTRYRVVRYLQDATLLELSPHTGRTHQLRVHMSSIGHPVLGDSLYGRKRGASDFTLLLHARRIMISLPGEECVRVFRAPLPEHFKEALCILRRPET